MATTNYRLINIDRLDPESACNFDITTLSPVVAPVSANEVQGLAGQVRQLLRAGDSGGALRGALENAPYGGDDQTKAIHLATVIEILQSIKQSEMSPLLNEIYQSEGGIECLDTLMKYLYKGMSVSQSSNKPPQAPTGFSQVHSRNTGEGGGAAMSVLLSWHEKVVEIAGLGSVVRVMTDRRVV